MASLGLKVKKQDFETRIEIVADKMADLQSVVDRYERAKGNLDQFIKEGDDNYENMKARIDENIKAAKKAYAALQETKLELEKDLEQLGEASSKIGNILEDAKDAAKNVIEAAIKVEGVL